MSQASAAHEEHHDHVAPLKTYYAIYGALLVLTVATVGVSVLAESTHMDHTISLVLAMAVALTKATLVCAFFMHLLHDAKFNVIVFLSAAWFAALFFIFTMADVGTRGWVLDVQNYSQFQQPGHVESVGAVGEASSAAPAEAAH